MGTPTTRGSSGWSPTSTWRSWPWIEGYLLFSHYGDVADFYTPEGTRHFAPVGGLLAPLRVSVPAPALLALVPPVFGAVGMIAWWRARRKALLVLLLDRHLLGRFRRGRQAEEETGDQREVAQDPHRPAP